MSSSGMTGREQKIIRANGVDLCVESFGDPGAPPILLIAGAASSMDYWEDGFCERLAAGPRFVIRYDLRDTGQSVTDEPGAPTYTGRDLVVDAIGVLDAFAVARAHLAGLSMGGAMCMLLALDYPDRVASLVLLSTTAGGPGGPGTAHPDLPPVSEKLQASFANPPPDPDWSDREAVIDYLDAGERPFEGTLPLDRAARRLLLGRIVDRTINVASSAKNHWILPDDDEEPLRPRLGRIRAPALVLHGTEDPLFPYGHGEALAREIPGATVIRLEGVGHEYPPRPVWDIVVPAILRHTAAS